MSNQLHFSIVEASQVAEARRAVVDLAQTLGFKETDAGKAALIVTEAATNLVKHATEGQLLARPLEQAGSLGLEILALDSGPGLANVGQALNDGYSTAGSLGTGLGAIVRLSTVFDIYSLPGKGAALLAQLWPQNGMTASPPRTGDASPDSLEIGGICLAKKGEAVSGDSWKVKREETCYEIMLVDGLGHGPEAARASESAVEVLLAKTGFRPQAMVEAAHLALAHTRGAALAVAEVDLVHEVVTFAGVGNIAGAIVALEGNRHLTSHNGIVGHQVRKVQEFSYPWSSQAVLVLHSDGLTTHWNLDLYPGLSTRHPSLIAGVLYRDFSRGNDDVTVVVVKQKDK